MAKEKPISLPKIPREKDYEDYISAYLQAGGLYVERSIIHREKEELLELDIITTDFQENNTESNLIEIKSGNWGFSEIFKIRGWMTFLNYEKGNFIVQQSRANFDYFKSKAKELSIELIDNSNLNETHSCLDNFFEIEPNPIDIATIRYAYWLERNMLKEIKKNKKSDSSIQGYKELDDYFFEINSSSFFSRNPTKRIERLFNAYLKYKNITAKICHELSGGNYDDEVDRLSKKCYSEVFYNPKPSILQTSIYIEHIARVTILKCVVEHIITRKKTNNQFSFDELSVLLSLPDSIQSGLKEIMNDKYFNLYPRFWQFFTYLFGGFILTDIEDKEYALLSERTGIPVEEIPNAFEAFNKLFPREEGWFKELHNSSIKWHMFFPVAFSGIGVNYRVHIYKKEDKKQRLEDIISSDNFTTKDMKKWFKIADDILKEEMYTK